METLALPKLRSMVRVLLQVRAGRKDSMGVPARFILEEVSSVGVFSCAENRELLVPLWK